MGPIVHFYLIPRFWHPSLFETLPIPQENSSYLTTFKLPKFLLTHYLHLSKTNIKNPIDTGRKLNVYKTFRRRPGRLLNVLSTFNLRPVSTGK